MAGAVDGFQAGHLIAQDTMDLFNTGYSVYQDQRAWQFQKENFDYQKALQQKIFEREDTAVQRRRADLEAAGLNPNLAAGSAAGAGAVVATSGGSGSHNLYKPNFMQNYGAYLDARKASEEIKQAEVATRILERRNDQDKRNQETQNTLDTITNLYNSGSDVSKLFVFITQEKDGYHINLQKSARLKKYLKDGVDNAGWIVHENENGKGGYGQDSFGNFYSFVPLAESKYWQALQNGWQLDLNDVETSNYDLDMLKRQEEWQTSDKWIDRIGRIVDMVLGTGNTAGNLIRTLKPKPETPKVKSINKTWSRNSSTTTYDY